MSLPPPPPSAACAALAYASSVVTEFAAAAPWSGCRASLPFSAVITGLWSGIEVLMLSESELNVWAKPHWPFAVFA